MEVSIGELMADYLRGVAAWRRSRFDDDLRDRRNLRSAQGLEELAAYVLALPAGDLRLVRLGELAVEAGRFAPGQQTHYEVGRFRFFSDAATLEGFLDRLVELAEADRSEAGRFGGPQVPGDDPWWEEEDEEHRKRRGEEDHRW